MESHVILRRALVVATGVLIAGLVLSLPVSADSQSLFKLGQVLEKQKQPLKAIEYYDRAYRADKNNLDALYAYVRACCENDRPGDLLAPCNVIVAADPQAKRFKAIYLYRANAYSAVDENIKAIEDCNKAIQLGFDGFSVRACRAQCYASANKVKEALADYDWVIAKYNECRTASYVYDRRARLLESCGQYQKAIADWSLLIGIFPKNPYYVINRAQDRAALGQYKEALADYDLAIKVDPKDDHSYFLRGKLKLKLGQFLAAAEDFSSSIKLDDEPSWTIYKLRAEAYEKGGKAELGKADRLKAAKMEQL